MGTGDRPARDDAGSRAAEHADERLPDPPTAEDGPERPSQLPRGSWWPILKRTVQEFNEDNVTDWAAALTYYGVLSLFPGMLVLVSVLDLAGRSTTQQVINSLTDMAPGPVRDLLRTAVTNLQNGRQGTAGVLALAGLAGALWSASGYVGAFMRAADAIFDVPEARPIYKTLPIRLGLTIVTGVCLAATALAVVLTGGLAERIGALVHAGSGAVLVWDIAKWPVLVVLVGLVFALLYWAAPNARNGGFRWISPGGLLAVVLWLIASGGFALYVTHFGSYNKTYGSLATVIVFLVWLWISNIAILLGGEFDAELQRQRAIVAGHPADKEPYLELRDTKKLDAERDDTLR